MSGCCWMLKFTLNGSPTKACDTCWVVETSTDILWGKSSISYYTRPGNLFRWSSAVGGVRKGTKTSLTWGDVSPPEKSLNFTWTILIAYVKLSWTKKSLSTVIGLFELKKKGWSFYIKSIVLLCLGTLVISSKLSTFMIFVSFENTSTFTLLKTFNCTQSCSNLALTHNKPLPSNLPSN